MLLCGLPLQKIVEGDEQKAEDTVSKCGEVVEACRQVLKKYTQDSAHAMQVRKLAVDIFDGLQKLHKLGRRERCWLECASILHDIGLSQEPHQHHKQSMNMILNEPNLPFTSNERRIVASIARYHRKALPKEKHLNLKTLTGDDAEKVRVLAGCLRVADALDYRHQGVVDKLNIKITPRTVTIECLSNQKEANLELEYSGDWSSDVCSSDLSL
jgi:exopolyphosphatase/guanosine-5'-triphosphate,3'-diphosphate pyrophosphatase